MICPKCNKNNSDDSVFCDFCGSRLDETPSPNEDKNDADNNDLLHKKTKNNKNLKTMLAIAAATLLTILIISIVVVKYNNAIRDFPNIQKISISETSKYSDAVANMGYKKNYLWNSFYTESAKRSVQYAESLLYHDLYISLTSSGRKKVLNDIVTSYSDYYGKSIDTKSVKKYFKEIESIQQNSINSSNTKHNDAGVNSILAISSPEKQAQIKTITKWADDFYDETGAFPKVNDINLNTLIEETGISTEQPYLMEFAGVFLLSKISEDTANYKAEYKKDAKLVDVSYRDEIRKQKEAKLARQRELERKRQEEAARQAELQRQREIEAENRQKNLEEYTRNNQNFYQGLLNDLQDTMDAANSINWY